RRAADVLPVGDLATEDLGDLILRERLHGVRGIHADTGARRADRERLDFALLRGGEITADVADVDLTVDRERHAGTRADVVEALPDDRRMDFREGRGQRLHRVDGATATLDHIGPRDRVIRRLRLEHRTGASARHHEQPYDRTQNERSEPL